MLERDLSNSPLIMKKIKNEIYAQNLYAAMCNMRWLKKSAPSVGIYAVTWRTAGGIIADLRGNGGTYLDWYCSGIGPKLEGEVSEGTVTEEIRQDLSTLGWIPVEYEEF